MQRSNPPKTSSTVFVSVWDPVSPNLPRTQLNWPKHHLLYSNCSRTRHTLFLFWLILKLYRLLSNNFERSSVHVIIKWIYLEGRSVFAQRMSCWYNLQIGFMCERHPQSLWRSITAGFVVSRDLGCKCNVPRIPLNCHCKYVDSFVRQLFAVNTKYVTSQW